MSAAAFSVPVSVRYLEVDQQGVVFNMWYLAWFDDAMTAYLAELGFDYEQMLASGFDVQVVHSSVDYRDGVRFRHAPEVRVQPRAIGTTSFRLAFKVVVDQREMVAAEIVYVCVGTDGSGKRAVPPALRAALEGDQGGTAPQ
jgi:acyl-CoA thioester hydrolase